MVSSHAVVAHLTGNVGPASENRHRPASTGAPTSSTLSVVPEPAGDVGFPLGSAAVLIRGTDRTLWALAARYTTERGGRFTANRWGGVDYLPTGTEPLLYVSTAGAPHPPSPDTGGVTPLLSAGTGLVGQVREAARGAGEIAEVLHTGLVDALAGLGPAPSEVGAFLMPAFDVCLPPLDDPYRAAGAQETHLRIQRRLLEWTAGRYSPRAHLDPRQAGLLHAGALAVLDSLARRLRESSPGLRPALVTALRTALRSGLSPAEVGRVDALARRGLLRFVGVEYSLAPRQDGYRLHCSAHPAGGLHVVEPRRR